MKLERLSCPPDASVFTRVRSNIKRAARFIKTQANRDVREFGPHMRRAVDIAGSFAGLVALMPLLLLAAGLIKLTSKGPVLFSQERVGHRGRPFRMWKLRTMYTDAEARKAALAATQEEAALDGPRFKLRRDPRITPIGRILRKLSIDELPQLYNVLRGDMTIVGPRPALQKEVNLYSPKALRRLEVKPGLTCTWQIGGRSDLSFQQQIDLDVNYIDQCTAKEEVVIVLRTVPAVILGRGAY